MTEMNRPQPSKQRWQPLRVGLIELYHYDVEEFWFEDGHLMLRGNNGTGKSKVLSLTLPFLLDASLSPARIEPDADPKKRVEWNLLMGGRFDRRTGYTWIEFGRLDDDGQPQFLTLGAGLRATAGRSSVDSWFFVTDQRVRHELALVDDNNTVATRDRLAELVGSHNLFRTARDYRRVVDERLFGLGVERYRALTDTLIQLRQPQLSKQPDENNLSRALSQAFPPLEQTVLGDVAEAMNQLDEYRDELEDHELMRDAVVRFNNSHVRYAQILARRRARDLRQVQTAVDNASAAARQAVHGHETAQRVLADCENRVTDTDTRRSEVAGQIDVLRDSPEMRSANELHRAQTEAETAERMAEEASRDEARMQQRLEQEQTERARRQQVTDTSREALTAALSHSADQAEAAGVADQHRHSGPETVNADVLARHPADELRRMARQQEQIAQSRHKQIEQIGRALAAVDAAVHTQQAAQQERDARQTDSEAAEADLVVIGRQRQEAAQSHIRDWQNFATQASQTLQLDTSRDWPDIEEILVDWVHSLDGPSPLEAHWQQLSTAELDRLARRDSALQQQQAEVDAARQPLLAEHTQLSEGREAPPPAPPTREAERTDRPGAPLWQLVDFTAAVTADKRAGIEAALQASGVLDAWVTPRGELLEPHTRDNWLVARQRQPHNLTQVLQCDAHAAERDDLASAARQIDDLLASVALVDDANAPLSPTAEYCVATDGRYRIGPAQGAWHKPAAEHIGFAAREAARKRRLQEIEQELAELAQREQAIEAGCEAVAAQRQALQQLQTDCPATDALRSAHAHQAAAERRAAGSRQQLAEAEQRLQTARQALQRAREALAFDAEDTGLPARREALDEVARAVGEYRLSIRATQAALREHDQALAELATQADREQAAQTDYQHVVDRADQQRKRAGTARARHAELARTVGADARDVMNRLNALNRESERLEHRLKTVQRELTAAHKTLGAAEQAREDTQDKLAEERERRGRAVTNFQAFAGTGLLRAAVPELAQPESDEPWTNDAALTAARGAEATLEQVDDGDHAWQRAQSRLGTEFAELQRALSARGFDSFGEPGEHGFVVRITFNQQQQAPDALQGVLEQEIGERRRLLTARETEIIENHLQAEIAAQLQGLMRAADARVAAINAELAQRPTSTGVKFKLVWEPVPDDDGTLTRLADVRKLLLDKISDAWTPADREAVGRFLQQRIDAERERDSSNARIDQLALALDYRSWHRFRVKRWQDGQWKPLSGPASSGERALGLTVPLFAAAASHYESAADMAPRLVLLDEAFAGIDDGARAHCMDLIREFDLDFVMTSEREWACYAE